LSSETKATNRPSPLIAGVSAKSSTVPLARTEIAPAVFPRVSRTNTPPSAFGSRLSANESNAMYRPSALIDGAVAVGDGKSAASPSDETLARSNQIPTENGVARDAVSAATATRPT
jgi:hypothetical protein